jgi:hypothetical protein
MNITPEDKKLIYTQYMEWVSKISDDLEDKAHFTAEELVYTVLAIVEKYYEC